MAKIAPYHTDSGEKKNVHHNNDGCYEGRKILPQHRQAGTGNKPLCSICQGL